MNKSEIRKALLSARRAMTPEDAVEKSTLILERLIKLPDVLNAGAFPCYVSSKDNEVDTHGLIQWLLERSKTVLVPIAQAERRMAWSRLFSLKDLAPGQFGIFEPRPECRRIVEPPDGSVAIVPGIAFTRDGYRIGYGGGFYDTFLAGFKGRSIAVAFDMQIIDDFGREEYDMPVDLVVTESGVIRI